MRTVIPYNGAELTLVLADEDRSFRESAERYQRLHGCERCNHAWAAHGRSGCGVEVDKKRCGCVGAAQKNQARRVA